METMGNLWSFRIQCLEWSRLSGTMLNGRGSYRVHALSRERPASAHVKRIANREVLRTSRIQHEKRWKWTSNDV
jgi:hypothetical protein